MILNACEEVVLAVLLLCEEAEIKFGLAFPVSPTDHSSPMSPDVRAGVIAERPRAGFRSLVEAEVVFCLFSSLEKFSFVFL